jgi:hypothetical protein
MITTTKNVTLTELKKIALVPPKGAKGYWKGIPHHEFIAAVITEATHCDYSIEEIRIDLRRSNEDMTAGFFITSKALPRMELGLGLRTSNGRRQSPQWFAGVVDRNVGISLVDIAVHAKLTAQNSTGREVDKWVKEVFTHLKRWDARFPEMVTELQRTWIPPEEIRRLFIESSNKIRLTTTRKLMPWRYVNDCITEIGQGKRTETAWNILWTFAHAATKSPAWWQMPSVRKFIVALLNPAIRKESVHDIT